VVAEGLPAHVRAASALRRLGERLVVVQDDVNALAVRGADGAYRPVLLPPHPSGQRVFDDSLGNKHFKLDLEASAVLPDGRLVAFGSGSLPARERVVLWGGRDPPVVVDAPDWYRRLRAAVTETGVRLNIEGALVSGAHLKLFQRGNDVRADGRARGNAIADIELETFVRWLDGDAAPPRVVGVTTVELGAVSGVPFTFTDAALLDDERIVVLACAEDTPSAITDGEVLGCRVGILDSEGLTTVDVYDSGRERTRLKLEGIEPRPPSRTEFDVAVDVDRPAAPAQLGRLVWER
jgi:hypothetical protein